MPAVSKAVNNLDAMEIQRRACSELSFGLSDSFSSPRSMPASPDAAFVVTPEGKALLAAMELQVDEKGDLHVVDLPIRNLKLDGDEPKITPVALPREAKSPFGIPIQGLSDAPPLKLGWEHQPMLPWRKAFHEDIKERRSQPTPVNRKTEMILEVDDDGVSHVHEVPCRVAAHKRNLESDSVCFVGDESGTVHHAHTVVISCPDDCECVVTRPDDDQSGVFDTIKTPGNINYSLSHPLIIIGEVDGTSHIGTAVMVCDQNGEIRSYARVSTLPKFTAPTTKHITYQTPKMLCWHSSGPALYKRVLYGRNDQVVVGYVSLSNRDLVAVSENGNDVKVVPTVSLPQRPKGCDITYLSDESGTHHTGMTVIKDSPCGLVKVSVLCEEDETVTVSEVKSMAKYMSMPGYQRIAGLSPPHRLMVEFPNRKMICPPAYYTELPRTDAATRRGYCKVCICDECGPVYFQITPKEDCTQHQVIVSDGKNLRIGLNIMYDSPVGLVIKSRV
eukprot:TRINITY_DN10470_c0_g1_i1.p1 TRINITY_DN10470_c0_g1~~TRINITY_DN10470_c0_g1_i1.p1  ORF type:complete len:502 (+),score=90.85 TRINITY_DN10470_c0_g1_i1:89-1594(+)